MNMSTTIVSNEKQATATYAREEGGLETCPVCDNGGPQKWLTAPDRFHGRKEEYTLLRCSNCALVWLSHPPKPAEMHSHYTQAYDRLIAAAGDNSLARWGFREKALAPYKASGALLDLGCSS